MPNTNFLYQFNLTANTDCTGVLFSNSTKILTDQYGIGYVWIDTNSINAIPNFLCEYRSLVGSPLELRKIHNISDQFFKNVYAQKVNASTLYSAGINVTNWLYNQTSGSITYINTVSTNLQNNISAVNTSLISGINTASQMCQSNITDLNNTYNLYWYNYTGTGDYYYNMSDGGMQYQVDNFNVTYLLNTTNLTVGDTQSYWQTESIDLGGGFGIYKMLAFYSNGALGNIGGILDRMIAIGIDYSPALLLFDHATGHPGGYSQLEYDSRVQQLNISSGNANFAVNINADTFVNNLTTRQNTINNETATFTLQELNTSGAMDYNPVNMNITNANISKLNVTDVLEVGPNDYGDTSVLETAHKAVAKFYGDIMVGNGTAGINPCILFLGATYTNSICMDDTTSTFIFAGLTTMAGLIFTNAGTSISNQNSLGTDMLITSELQSIYLGGESTGHYGLGIGSIFDGSSVFPENNGTDMAQNLLLRRTRNPTSTIMVNSYNLTFQGASRQGFLASKTTNFTMFYQTTNRTNGGGYLSIWNNTGEIVQINDNGTITTNKNIQTAGCIQYNGGTLGTCV